MKQRQSANPEFLGKRLIELFATYGRDGSASNDQYQGYMDALEGITEQEIVRAFPVAVRRKNSDFPPSPGEIMAVVEELRDQEPGEEPIECKSCGGTGWKIVERAEGKAAVPCDCLPPERKQAAKDWARQKATGWR